MTEHNDPASAVGTSDNASTDNARETGLGAVIGNAASAGRLAWDFLKQGFQSFVPRGQKGSVALSVLGALALTVGVAEENGCHIAVFATEQGGKLAMACRAGDTRHVVFRLGLVAPTALGPADANAVEVPTALGGVMAKLRDDATPALAAGIDKARSLAEAYVDRTHFDEAELQPVVINAVREATDKTGTDAAYLMAVAWKESRFDVAAESKTSTAKGLFQFTEVTWFRAVKAFGERHGLGRYGAAINELEDGRMVVRPDMRAKILELRDDPALAAAMTAEFAQLDRERLEKQLGRSVSDVDVYFAHFLGISTATAFLKAVDTKPKTRADVVAKQAVKANPAIFIRDGRVITVREAYERLKHVLEERQGRYGQLLKVAAAELPRGARAWAPPPPKAKPALSPDETLQLVLGEPKDMLAEPVSIAMSR